MKKLQYALFLALLFSLQSFSQDMCPFVASYLKVENEADIPMVTDNGDGTITLIHPDPSIADIFSDYTIYSFERSFPTSNSKNLMKYYTISCNSKSLFIDIQNEISESIYFIETDYSTLTSIPDDLVDFVDGKRFKVNGYISTTDLDGCTFNCELNEVPVDFNLEVAFEYDITEDLLYIESYNDTPCGNTFSVALKASIEDDFINNTGLQLWEAQPATETNGSCPNAEQALYNILGIFCYGEGIDFSFLREGIINEEEHSFRFRKYNALQGENVVSFKDATLSVTENDLNTITLYQSSESGQIQVDNTSGENISAAMYTLSGKLVVATHFIQDNQIDISHLSENQLYFVRLKTENGQSKTVKFIKR